MITNGITIEDFPSHMTIQTIIAQSKLDAILEGVASLLAKQNNTDLKTEVDNLTKRAEIIYNDYVQYYLSNKKEN